MAKHSHILYEQMTGCVFVASALIFQMFHYRRSLCKCQFFFICFIIFSPAHAQKTIIPSDFLGCETQFTSTGRDTVYGLPHRFLISGTVRLIFEDRLLTEGIDYEVNLLRGEIHFSHPPDSGGTFIVTYRRLPVHLQLQYRHFTSLDTILKGEKAIPAVSQTRPASKKKSLDYGEELQRSGSIFRGVSLGTNQGMRLQSGLRLQLSGNIAPMVEVVASLTDQNTPIQPEGNTQTLQEIDKVFVKIKAPGFRATLGDYVFDVSGSDFGSYSRKLQGIMSTGESSFGSVTLSAAASKGEFTTNNFMGQEGSQGPYQLTGSRGQREIIVLAGTERVWIDGEPMIRGEENDYTIEYGNGQMTFTRNRLITGDSRITVDFEYSDQKFQKEIYGAVGELRLWKDRIKLRTSFLREADDKENPLDIILTDEYRQILEMAGDDPDSAMASGAKYMGEDQGSYERVDTTGIVYYRYVGAYHGDYAVRFSYLGHGQGDYNFQGYGIYRYEGPGKGSYLPVIYIPVAVSHQVADFATSIDLGKGLHIEGEIGISDRDLNRYSSLDDGDNIDIAYSSQFRMDRQNIRISGKGLGEMSFKGSVRSVGENFRSMGRMTEVEHGRKWGVEEGVSWGEQMIELQSGYRPFSFWTVEGEMGMFRREGSFRSDRKMVMTDFSKPKLPSLRYSAELIETERGSALDGYWLRQQGTVQGRWRGLTPSLRYLGEHRREDEVDSVRTGFRFDEWTGGLAFEKGFFKGMVEETIRDDRLYDAFSLKKNSLARTDRIQFMFRWGRGLSSSFMYTHRDRDYTDPVIEDQKSDLADMKIRFSPERRYLDGTIHYRFSSTQVSEMVRDTIRVGDGQGNYRYDEDLEELVPDSDGNIFLRMIQTGHFLPVNELKMGGEIRLDGARIWKEKKGIQKFIASWRSRTLIRIERRDRERDFGRVNRSAFNPSWGGDSTMVMGLIMFHEDLEYTSPTGRLSMRLRYRNDDSENHQLAQEGLIRHMQEKSLRLKASPVKSLGLLAEYLIRDESKFYTARVWSNRDVRSHAWTMEASYRPKQKIEIALKAKLKIARDACPIPNTEAMSLFLLPRFGYSFRGRGHLRAELEIGRVRSKPEEQTLPYEMLGGDQPGQTLRWTVLLTYRLTGHVMATLNYRGRQEPWRKSLYQTGQVEVRAFF